ncbi:MAG: DUF1640 domain-containing protein [Pseudomonadota bacterium]|nr:DUF1640 domain-containing protein [Pseudomonadota bacterium]MDE3037119.1 DUF1640 domain-containing protein [Pseudomonadota bacterium]
MSYTATFHTHKAVKRLTSQGVNPVQAEVFVDVIRESQTTDKDNLVTKADLAELKAELLKWYIGIAMFQTVTFLAGIIAIARILHP